MREGNLRYAVLGVIARQDGGVHCYRLTRECEALHDDFWELNYGRISRVLDMLERDGAVEAAEEHQSGRPNRKVYRITGKGEQSLDDWLLQPVSDTPYPLRDELSIKLLFLEAERVEETGQLIDQQRQIYLGKLARVGRRRRKLQNLGIRTDTIAIVMEGAEMRVRTDLAWLDLIERRINERLPSERLPG